jgi:hypothetical protein
MPSLLLLKEPRRWESRVRIDSDLVCDALISVMVLQQNILASSPSDINSRHACDE